MRRFRTYYTLPLALLLALWVWPLVSGDQTLFLRDVLHSHYPLKVSQAEAMRGGDLLPLIDPYRSFGQPLLGNPNAVPLHPLSLLLLVASPLWVLNAHFWIHWLLAPCAGYWLGRAWGLGRPAAVVVGASYATGGFFLSLMNLYNLVAGAAFAPAFVAAVLDACDPARRDRPGSGRRAAVAGLLWALLLLAGDPLYALLAAAMAATAVIARQGLDLFRRAQWPVGARLAIAGILGTLVAAPQWVEMARILPLSFRGHFQYSPSAILAQSWDPRTLIEWLLPRAFSAPGLDYWGARLHGGNEPLLFSLHPGMAVLVLALVAGWRGSAVRWGWAMVATSSFLVLGVWNPLILGLVQWQSTAVMRYPVKLWLVGAVGLAVLAGAGMERLVHGGGGRRAATLLLLAGSMMGLLCGLLMRTSALDGVLARIDPGRLAPGEPERLRWALLAFLVGLSAVFLALLLAALRHRPLVFGAALILVHAGSQLAFLSPLLATDAADPYRRRPAILGELPQGARLVHGGHRSIFGTSEGPFPNLPALELRWFERLYVEHGQPFAGIPWGWRYAMNASPEGLDSFYAIALERRLAGLDDPRRVRLLAASGVDVLLLDRELAPEARALVRPVARHDAFERPVHAYALERRATTPRVVGEALPAPHFNSVVDHLVDPRFAPARQVILPGSGPAPPARPPGRVHEVVEDRDGLTFTVDSPAGGWAVVERAYLPIYRARVDERDAELLVADGQLMAVAVEPGSHRVEIAVDRRPTRLAAAVALLALVALLAMPARGVLAARGGRRRGSAGR